MAIFLANLRTYPATRRHAQEDPVMLNVTRPNRSMGLALGASLAAGLVVIAVVLTQALERAQAYV